jgi:hypothetical protein
MAEFQGATFDELGDGDGSGFSFGSSVVGRRLIVPGSSRVIVQRNSSSVHLLQTQALCSYAEVEALRAKVGSTGVLSLSKTEGVSLLLSVSPARVFDSTCYVVDLSFRYGGAIGPEPSLGGYGFNYGNTGDAI